MIKKNYIVKNSYCVVIATSDEVDGLFDGKVIEIINPKEAGNMEVGDRVDCLPADEFSL